MVSATPLSAKFSASSPFIQILVYLLISCNSTDTAFMRFHVAKSSKINTIPTTTGTHAVFHGVLATTICKLEMNDLALF
jgi:hypothetical protein